MSLQMLHGSKGSSDCVSVWKVIPVDVRSEFQQVEEDEFSSFPSWSVVPRRNVRDASSQESRRSARKDHVTLCFVDIKSYGSTSLSLKTH